MIEGDASITTSERCEKSPSVRASSPQLYRAHAAPTPATIAPTAAVNPARPSSQAKGPALNENDDEAEEDEMREMPEAVTTVVMSVEGVEGISIRSAISKSQKPAALSLPDRSRRNSHCEALMTDPLEVQVGTGVVGVVAVQVRYTVWTTPLWKRRPRGKMGKLPEEARRGAGAEQEGRD